MRTKRKEEYVMYLIPEVKSTKKCEKFKIDGCTFEFGVNIDKRVINATKNIKNGKTNVKINVSDEGKVEYKMTLSENSIEIEAKSQKGAFYAIQTLRQIIKNGTCDACEIIDSPDFETRGFYYDITRGRIPTLDTLKELVDNLAYYKIDMLQLYVEHVFPFKEYDGIYQRTGYMTPEETMELDKYCQENFIELVPSLSCFGHLYELLESDKYKHLCELPDYKNSTIFWCERMAHHTIDPSNPESIELIKSLIDQYSPLFTSDKFNICCDETFDLGRGRNQGKDKGKIYVDFVKKVLDYVKSKGKKPMMWGDIIAEHSDLIADLGEDILFLSWRYDANPDPKMIYKIRDAKKPQYVCPGLNNWTSLTELTHVSIPNITKMAEYGYSVGAKGILTTCWGDYGHISPIYACMYGLIYSAAKGWNVKCEYNNFDEAIDKLYYGYNGASKLVNQISRIHRVNYWYNLVCDYSNELYSNDVMKSWNKPNPDDLNKAFYECEDIIPYLEATTWENEKARKALLVVVQGIEYMISMLMSKITGEKLGVIFSYLEKWIKDYSEIYLQESKQGELKEFIKVIYALGEKYLK